MLWKRCYNLTLLAGILLVILLMFADLRGFSHENEITSSKSGEFIRHYDRELLIWKQSLQAIIRDDVGESWVDIRLVYVR